VIKRLIFVRHGESEHHVNGMTGGWTDTPLTDRGRRQAATTARHLAALDFSGTGFFTSDLLRASQTAEIIGDQLGRQPVSLDALREVNNGEATGLSVAEAKNIERPQPAVYDPDWTAYPGGESMKVLDARMRAALAELADTGHSDVLVVGHGFSGTLLLKAWLGLPIQPYIAFNLSPASVTEFFINEFSEPCIERLNATFGEG
jgi:probable phosphoglycerate mutase